MVESKYNHYLVDNEKKSKIFRIYNSLTKACIETEDQKIIEHLLEEGAESLKTLRDLGFVVDDDFDELEAMKYMYNKVFFGRGRNLTLVLVPSLACNFNCPYCFEKKEDNGSWFKTDINSYFECLKHFIHKNHDNYDTIEFALFGGEPLLFINQFADFFDFVSLTYPNLDYQCSIVTNGSLLSEKALEIIFSHHCRSLQITIDGCKAKHDELRIFKDGTASYDLLVQNIRHFVKTKPNDIQFVLRINLNSVSLAEVKEALSEFEYQDRKKINILFRPIYNTSTYTECNSNRFGELSDFIELASNMGYSLLKNAYRYQPCEAASGENFFFVMPDMTLWKCINDLDCTEPQIGRIDKSGELVLQADKLILWHKYCNWTTDPECVKCKMLPDCFGGCVLKKVKGNGKACRNFDMICLPFLY